MLKFGRAAISIIWLSMIVLSVVLAYHRSGWVDVGLLGAPVALVVIGWLVRTIKAPSSDPRSAGLVVIPVVLVTLVFWFFCLGYAITESPRWATASAFIGIAAYWGMRRLGRRARLENVRSAAATAAEHEAATGEGSRLDLLALRLAVAGDGAMLRPDSGAGIRVIGGQLAELALADILVDHDGLPTILYGDDWATGPMSFIRSQVLERSGVTWEQLLSPAGIDAATVLRDVTTELVEKNTWKFTAPADPFSAPGYVDIEGSQLRLVAAHLDAAITGRATPTSRELILIALTALRFTNSGSAWQDRDWVAELPDFPERRRETLQRIIQAADTRAMVMRSGTDNEPLA